MQRASRSFIFLSFLLIGILVLVGCSGRGGAKKLVIYSPHGKEMLSEFEKRYESLHPDVDVQWLDMGSQDVY